MSIDHRTRYTISTIHNGEVICSESSMGSPDIFQEGTNRHYALIYARILNPDIPADAPVTIREETIYGKSETETTLAALHPNYEYMREQVLARFADGPIRYS